MNILLIDNGSTLEKKLELLLPATKIVRKSESVLIGDAEESDVIILSGSATLAVKYDYEKFANEIQIIITIQKPIIGICFGCELISRAFGGEVRELARRDKGIKKIQILDKTLFDKSEIEVYENHKWAISKLPDDFLVVAESETGPEIIKHKDLPIYGFQFHPENMVDQTEGDELFRKLISHFS